MVLGSANYVAPEQAQGDDVARPPTSTRSAACCSRRSRADPYTGANPVAIATQHVSPRSPTPPAPPDLPAPAADLIRRALAKHPADRFPSATALADLSTAPPRTTAPAPGLPRRRQPRPRCRGPRRGG